MNDPIVAILAFALGALLACVLDDSFGFTARVSSWLGRLFDQA